MDICVYGASSKSLAEPIVQATERLGELIAERGHRLVFGAGDSGVMGAAARGVFRKGGETIGIVPEFFNVDGVLFPHCTRLIRTDTMRERKSMLEKLADAFIVAPGGFGTYDEMFEILTLKQLDRHDKAIVIFNVNGFYDKLFDFFDEGIKNGVMKEKAKSIYAVCNTPEEVLDALERYTPTEFSLNELKDVDLLNDDDE